MDTRLRKAVARDEVSFPTVIKLSSYQLAEVGHHRLAMFGRGAAARIAAFSKDVRATCPASHPESRNLFDAEQRRVDPELRLFFLPCSTPASSSSPASIHSWKPEATTIEGLSTGLQCLRNSSKRWLRGSLPACRTRASFSRSVSSPLTLTSYGQGVRQCRSCIRQIRRSILTRPTKLHLVATRRGIWYQQQWTRPNIVYRDHISRTAAREVGPLHSWWREACVQGTHHQSKAEPARTRQACCCKACRNQRFLQLIQGGARTQTPSYLQRSAQPSRG